MKQSLSTKMTKKKMSLISIGVVIALAVYLIVSNFTIKDGQIKRYYGDARDIMTEQQRKFLE